MVTLVGFPGFYVWSPYLSSKRQLQRRLHQKQTKGKRRGRLSDSLPNLRLRGPSGLFRQGVGGVQNRGGWGGSAAEPTSRGVGWVWQVGPNLKKHAQRRD